MSAKLYGTGVALVTPFDENREIDFKGLKRLLDTTAEKGVDYYVVQGTTGESATTTASEKSEILAFVKDNNTSKLPIVYGIGGNNTADVINKINSTDLNGIDAILSVCPYYNKPSQPGIIKHYQAIADASPVPVILYNVPGRTGSNLTAATTLELAQHEKIIGIKEASGIIEQLLTITKNKPRHFMLISGDDMLSSTIYAMGGVGVISVLANAFSGTFRDMKEAAFSNNFSGATTALAKLLSINPLMYAEGNPVGVKQVLQEQGICKNYVRLPLTEASQLLTEQIKTALHNM